MAEELGLSKQEVERCGVLAELVGGRMRQARASELLGLSVRQVKRLVQRYRMEGELGLRSKRRGRASNRGYAPALREQVLHLASTRYEGFGPTLLAEYLLAEQSLRLAPETLRQWLSGAGLHDPRGRRQSLHRARKRRPRFGELVQIDGSPHDWFEGRGPRCTLIVFIDDATSRVLYARWVPSETTQAYFDGFATSWREYGLPLAYYSDRHSIFRVNQDTAQAQPTQVERALRDAQIELICAHSPQAKGRVERVHQTFQDRLVKALRLAQINDLDAANAFLQTWLPTHNQRFAKPPCDPANAHRPCPYHNTELARRLHPQHPRKVNHQGAVIFRKQALQLPKHAWRRQVGQTLTVIEYPDRLELHDGQQPLAFDPFDLQNWRGQVLDRKQLDALLDRKPKTNQPPHIPAPNHPWRKKAIPTARSPL